MFMLRATHHAQVNRLPKRTAAKQHGTGSRFIVRNHLKKQTKKGKGQAMHIHQQSPKK
jgi:hypothetical protein